MLKQPFSSLVESTLALISFCYWDLVELSDEPFKTLGQLCTWCACCENALRTVIYSLRGSRYCAVLRGRGQQPSWRLRGAAESSGVIVISNLSRSHFEWEMSESGWYNTVGKGYAASIQIICSFWKILKFLIEYVSSHPTCFLLTIEALWYCRADLSRRRTSAIIPLLRDLLCSTQDSRTIVGYWQG